MNLNVDGKLNIEINDNNVSSPADYQRLIIEDKQTIDGLRKLNAMTIRKDSGSNHVNLIEIGTDSRYFSNLEYDENESYSYIVSSEELQVYAGGYNKNKDVHFLSPAKFDKAVVVPTPTADNNAVPKSYVDNISTPLGGIILWPGSSGVVPANFLLCNGAEISRTTYAGLFNIIGTTFGAGDGSTTFKLPDMRDRFPVGAGNLYSRGNTGGSKDAVIVRHEHFIKNNANGGRVGIGNGNPGFNRINNFTLDTDVGQEIIAAPTGESGTDKNMPPYLALYYIIRAK